MEESSLAEDLLGAVVVRLVRKGLLDSDDIMAIAADFMAKARVATNDDDRMRFEELAHAANCLILEVEAPASATWPTSPRLRVVSTDPDRS